MKKYIGIGILMIAVVVAGVVLFSGGAGKLSMLSQAKSNNRKKVLNEIIAEFKNDQLYMNRAFIEAGTAGISLDEYLLRKAEDLLMQKAYWKNRLDALNDASSNELISA